MGFLKCLHVIVVLTRIWFLELVTRCFSLHAKQLFLCGPRLSTSREDRTPTANYFTARVQQAFPVLPLSSDTNGCRYILVKGTSHKY